MEQTDYIQLFQKFLQKQASPEEMKTLIRWIKSEGSFHAWMDKEWSAADLEIDTTLRQRMFEQIQERVAQKEGVRITMKSRYRSLYLWAGRIASVVLLLILTGLSVYYYTANQYVTQDMLVSVEKGQKATVVLPDGSKVWVNSDSELRYGSRFNSKERQLHLEGEAYFEVAKDPNRPFIVQTNELSVRALGTSFNVKSYEEENYTSAVLTTGSIEVTTNAASLILKPNERVLFDKKTGLATLSRVDYASDYSNWKDNALTFKGESFENIAHTLERYYNTHIVFESESLKKYRFTGTTGNTSLESILQILSLTSPLSYEIRDSVIVLRENMKQKAYYEKALR